MPAAMVRVRLQVGVFAARGSGWTAARLEPGRGGQIAYGRMPVAALACAAVAPKAGRRRPLFEPGGRLGGRPR